MAKYFLVFLYTYFLMWVSSAWSQGFDDFGSDDSSAEQMFKEEKKSTNPLYEFWKKSGKGKIGTGRVIGSSTNRGYSFLDLRIDHTFSTNTKAVVAGIVEFADVKVDIELEPSEDGRASGVTEGIQREFKYDATNVRPQEIYLKQDIFDSLGLSYGFQKVVLGQFEPFSPNNFAMPWNLSSLAVGLSKTDNTLPQEVGILDFYPTSQTQFSLYYFPRLTYDRLVADELDEIVTRETGEISTLALPGGSDAAQKMARLMFYPSWGTVGLTYYNGYHSSFPVQRARLRPRTGTDLYERYDSSWTFAKNEMYSFEMAIPVGRFTYKIEYARHTDLEALSSSGYNAGTMQADEFVDAIRDINGGGINVPFDRKIAAVGLTANLQRWYINLMIMHMDQSYEGNAKELKDLEKRAIDSQMSGNDDGSDISFMPGLVASYYLDPDKQSEIGLAAGIVGTGFGGMLFYQKRTDSFTYGGGFQAVSYFSNNSLENSLPEGYELADDMTVGFTLNLNYNF